MRLNGWQRIGIVLSIVVALVSAYQMRTHRVDSAFKSYRYNNELCKLNSDRQQCELAESEKLNNRLASDWDVVIIAALTPVILGWVLVYFGLWVFRWVRRGFQQKEPS